MEINKYSLSQLASIYCIYKDLSLNRTVNCCTCGKTLHINNIEDCFNFWGHFISRSVNKKLIYYPKNTHAQCVNCNVVLNNSNIHNKYVEYMEYRYGKDIYNELLKVEQQTNEYYVNYYIEELLKLSIKFSELEDIFIDKNTGELITSFYENEIEKQFYTYSITYKQDLDKLCKMLKCESIEYERL